MVQRLFQAYFTDGLNVADHQVLADLATGVGLDRDATLAALASGRFADAVDADVEQARQMGISGVPFFVFAGKYAVSGAQPVEVFGQALETSLERDSRDRGRSRAMTEPGPRLRADAQRNVEDIRRAALDVFRIGGLSSPSGRSRVRPGSARAPSTTGSAAGKA